MMRQPPPRPAPNNGFAKLRNALPAYLLATMIFLAACTPAQAVATTQPTAPPTSTPTATPQPTAPPTAVASETPEPTEQATPETSAQSVQLRAEVLALVNPDNLDRSEFPTVVALFLRVLNNESIQVVAFEQNLAGFAPGTSYVQIEKPNAQGQLEQEGYYLFSGYYVAKDGVVKLGTNWVLSEKDLESKPYQDMLELYAYLTEPVTNQAEYLARIDKVSAWNNGNFPAPEMTYRTVSLGPLLTGEPPIQFEGPIPTVAQIRNLPRQQQWGTTLDTMTLFWEYYSYVQNPDREHLPEIQHWISILPSPGAEHPWLVGYSVLSSSSPNNPPHLLLVLPDLIDNLQYSGSGQDSDWDEGNRIIYSPLVLGPDSTVRTSGIRHYPSVSPIHTRQGEQPELPIRTILETILLEHGFSPADVDRVINAGAFAITFHR